MRQGYFDHFSFLCLYNLFLVFLIVCVLSVGFDSRSECSLDVTKSRVLRLVQSWPVSSSFSHHFNSCSKLSSINHLMQYTVWIRGRPTHPDKTRINTYLKTLLNWNRCNRWKINIFGWFQNFLMKCEIQHFWWNLYISTQN